MNYKPLFASALLAALPVQNDKQSSQFLADLESGLEAGGWQVDSNPPSYQFPITDSQGNTYMMHGLSLIKPFNPGLKYSQAKVDVNSDPSQIASETAFRDALPNPLNTQFQLVYLENASSVSPQDMTMIDTALRQGGLTETIQSTTPVDQTTWGKIKSLYQ